MTRVVLIGPPGVGKGTQALRLSAALRVPAISTGDIFRDHIARGSGLGRRIESIVNTGGLVDDEIVTELVRHRLREPDAVTGFILDGYPRTPQQAADLEGMLDAEARIDAAVLLHADEEVLLSRLIARAAAQHRADDTEPVIRERLRAYARNAVALVDHYEQQYRLARVDGNAPADEVGKRLLEAVRVLDSASS